jgi:prostamide/prostaglandin F2alpha synthase
VQLHRDREKFEAAGARLVVIGQGTPEQAAHFRESLKLDFPIYVDRRREAYEAAGAKVATFDELLGPRVVAKGAAAVAKLGVHQGKTVGHPAQLGGVLVVLPGDDIVYCHLAGDASDNPPNSEVLAAVKAAAAP